MAFLIRIFLLRRWRVIITVYFMIIFLCILIFYPESNNIDLSNNYLDLRSDLGKSAPGDSFVIVNEKCSVPNVDLWSPEVQMLFENPPYPKCNESVKITSVKGNMVVINESEIQKLGYELQDISCCYKTIERISQNKDNYTYNADNLYRYSEECYKLENGTTPISGFIRVSCKLIKNTWFSSSSSLLYEQFHAVPVFPEENILRSKLSFWKKKWEEGGIQMPPNVLVIGIDSTSRLNFNRMMNATIATLRDVICAEEMTGFTKVGENTFPNFVPFLTSLTVEELTQLCYSAWTPQDDCPYIWREFSANKYLTAHLEDSPYMAIFNYEKTGFVEAPVDFYLRPFMLAAYYEANKRKAYKVKCIGHQRPEEIILDFINGLATLAHKRKIPFFITSWLTDLSHDNMFNVQHMDHMLSETLLNLHGKGILENTVIFVMSDHGYRFLKIRSTKTGWYEDKMPALWIKLPSSSSYATWTASLKQNSKQMITPFDLNYALRDILESFPPVDGGISKPEPEYLEKTPKLRAISPFQQMPARTCDEAGIQPGFCPCSQPIQYRDKEFIHRATKYFTDYINRKLPKRCIPLRVKSVTGFGTPDKSKILNDELDYPEISVMAVETTPGNFLYEVWLKYDKIMNRFTEIINIFRTSMYDGSANCLTEADLVNDVEPYCFCRRWYHLI